MVAPAPFASVEELTQTLQRPDLDRDTALLALSRASAAVRGECHWFVSRQTVTGAQPNTGRGQYRLWLPTLWLVSVDAVTEGVTALAPGSDFTWDQHGVVYRNGRWPTLLNAVVMSYTHGYDVDHPNYLSAKDVTLSVASRIVSNPLQRANESTGSESWSTGRTSPASASLTEGEKDQLAPFRLED